MNENLLRSETKSSTAIYYANRSHGVARVGDSQKRIPLRSRKAAECGSKQIYMCKRNYILRKAIPYARSAAAKRAFILCVSERSECRAPSTNSDLK
ncbi:MAG: hypothetical protein LBH47_01830 [Christensenellaceae bacterium]|nr:hypothetical protein [Christensenellaceae bacterium]